MAKKKFKFLFDSPVVLTICAVSALVVIFDSFVFKGKAVANVFSCPGSHGENPFRFTNPLHYFTLLLHVFGSSGWQAFFVNTLVLLALGPQLEERYGSVMLGLMCGITVLVSGVLTACLGLQAITGTMSLVFLMIFLASLTTLSKNSLLASWTAGLVLYIAYSLYSGFQNPAVERVEGVNSFIFFMQRNVVTFINMAGGLCGSLFGFLVAPKKRAAPKKKPLDLDESSDSPSSWKNQVEETVVAESAEEKAEKKTKKKKSKASDDDEVVIGTIEL
ncbi:MAG: rhomboid family intramembrane serine protease [Treponema sp.]|nr:rhomboid family intramembrane serine protease [Treponema sp.]